LEQNQHHLEQGFQELRQSQQQLEQGFQELRQSQQQLEQGFQELQQNQLRLEHRMQELEQNQRTLEQNQKEMSSQIDDIYRAVVRIEDGQPQDIYALLRSIHHKFNDTESEISALNRRVFRLESAFERIGWP
jgi:septation ring formation regulator EzrA